MYGVYSIVSKKFVFGICELSKTKALQKLRMKIGNNSYKWRFEVRRVVK